MLLAQAANRTAALQQDEADSQTDEEGTNTDDDEGYGNDQAGLVDFNQ